MSQKDLAEVVGHPAVVAALHQVLATWRSADGAIQRLKQVIWPAVGPCLAGKDYRPELAQLGPEIRLALLIVLGWPEQSDFRVYEASQVRSPSDLDWARRAGCGSADDYPTRYPVDSEETEA